MSKLLLQKFHAKAQRSKGAKEEKPLCAFASLRLCVKLFKLKQSSHTHSTLPAPQTPPPRHSPALSRSHHPPHHEYKTCFQKMRPAGCYVPCLSFARWQL